jgi:hypothetical protein
VGGTTTQPVAISGALVAADGRHVVVPYTAGGCVQGATLTAAETGSAVTLVLRQILSGSSACPGDLVVGTAAAVTLRHPLWGRSLLDGSTGRPIPYFDGRTLLRITYLPPGYRFSAYLPFPSPAFTAWEREFISSGQATAPVDVEQVPGNATVPPSWPVTSRVRVGSRLAAMGVLTGNGQVLGQRSPGRPAATPSSCTPSWSGPGSPCRPEWQVTPWRSPRCSSCSQLVLARRYGAGPGICQQARQQAGGFARKRAARCPAHCRQCRAVSQSPPPAHDGLPVSLRPQLTEFAAAD